MTTKPRTAKQKAATKKAQAARKDTRAVGNFDFKAQLLEMLKKAPDAMEESAICIKLYGKDDRTPKRRIQNALKALYAEGDNDFGLIREKLGKSTTATVKWSIDPDSVLLRNLDLGKNLDKALAFDLAKKYLRDVLPPRSYESLRPYFDEAHEKLSKSMDAKEKRNVNLLKKRVEIAQRGMMLKKADVDSDILDTLYDAIMRKRCIDIDYERIEGRKDLHESLHPAGVVIKPPKLFLYAATTDDFKKRPKNPYRAFQINLIRSVKLRQEDSDVPDTFDMKPYIQDGYTDVLYASADTSEHRVRIHVTETGNLIRDLRQFPLYHWKRLEKEKDYWVFELETRITHPLVRYIVEQGDTFKVVEPPELVEAIKKHLNDTLTRYNTP